MSKRPPKPWSTGFYPSPTLLLASYIVLAQHITCSSLAYKKTSRWHHQFQLLKLDNFLTIFYFIFEKNLVTVWKMSKWGNFFFFCLFVHDSFIICWGKMISRLRNPIMRRMGVRTAANLSNPTVRKAFWNSNTCIAVGMVMGYGFYSWRYTPI